jgi:succinate dehydrogenase / fumarate reductase cytochrome b subunit
MGFIKAFYGTTVGKKIAMAATGLVLVGFVVGHMVGNLKIFFGIDPKTGHYKLDDYAYFLHSMGSDLFGHEGVLWIVRVVLLGAVVIHAFSGIQLARLNRRAKPVGYQNPNYRSANAASRTMLYGGLFLIAFIIFHLLHFTTGHVHTNGFAEGQVYSNVWKGFQNPLAVGFYLVAMGFLCLHLFHGTWSMFQTLGVDTPKWNGGIRFMAKCVAVGLFVGFSVVPLSRAVGVLPPPDPAVSAAAPMH